MRLLNPLAWHRPKSQRAKPRRPSPYGPGRGRGRAHRRARWPLDRRLWRRAGVALAVGGAIAGTGWLWTSGLVERGLDAAGRAMLMATANAGLKVDDVLVEGRARTERSAVLAALGVERGVPVLAFDPHAAQARLESLPWIRSAIVERRLPGVIYVHLTERRPLALWQREGRLTVIDQDGAIIAGAEPKIYARLPLVVGDDAPGHAADLLAMLDSEPELKPKVSAAVRVRGRRWNVRLEGGIDVRLPEQDAAAAWSELARVQREHGVLGRDVVIIDLRMPDRLIVRTAPGAATDNERKNQGEDT